MSEYRVLDLFCGLGGFSQAFEQSDRWAVTTVDIEARFDPDITADVMDLRPSDFDQTFDVVLASPPCTEFSRAAAWADHFDDDQNPQTAPAQESVALLYHTVGLIRALAPRFWLLENPMGSKVKQYLDKPTGQVTYCQYGTGYQKPTYLWGQHPPMTYRWCQRDGHCHDHGSLEDERDQRPLPRDPAERAKVPAELSAAIRDACERALDGDAPEQTTLAESVAVPDGGESR
jgi:hypothetical protein